MMTSGMYSSNSNEWETPQAFYNQLDKKYHFGGDLAATDDNHKCERYLTKKDNALEQNWQQFGKGRALFLNPPYGRQIKDWVRKAYEESVGYSAPIVLLIPARTDTAYWHDYIFGKAHVSFLRGRLKFEQHGLAVGGVRRFLVQWLFITTRRPTNEAQDD